MGGQTFLLEQSSRNNELQNDIPQTTDFIVDILILQQDDFIILTQNGNLYQIRKGNIVEIRTLIIDGIDELMPQILSIPGFLIVAYSHSSFLINLFNNNTETQITNWSYTPNRYYSEVKNNYLFSAIGNQGLEVYQITENYNFILHSVTARVLNLQSVDFRDFSIIKFTDKKYLIYVLCKNNGILVIEMTSTKESLTFKLLLKYIGPKNEGIVLDLYDEDSVFVGYKVNRSYFLIRYRIDAYNKKWSSTARYNITNKIIDIDVSEKYTLVQGLHKHHLIYYKETQKPISFLMYGVKQFILSGNQIQGTTSSFVFNLSSTIEPYQIKCYLEYEAQFDQKYKLMYRTSQSWRQLEFKVYFNQESEMLSEQLILLIIFGVVILLLIPIVIYNLKQWRLKSEEKENLEKKIHSLPQNRASKLIMPHTFRQVTSQEQRINTYNYTEDTIVHRDKKTIEY